MANKDLKSLKFPNLSDTYLIPEIDNTLTQTGKAADAKATGDELSALRTAIDPLGIKENFTIDIAGVAGPTSKTIYGNFKSGDEIRISCTLTKTGTGDYNCAVKPMSISALS